MATSSLSARACNLIAGSRPCDEGCRVCFSITLSRRGCAPRRSRISIHRRKHGGLAKNRQIGRIRRPKTGTRLRSSTQPIGLLYAAISISVYEVSPFTGSTKVQCPHAWWLLLLQAINSRWR
ncbi:unnamed protein product, partial [Laminaria digitata]